MRTFIIVGMLAAFSAPYAAAQPKIKVEPRRWDFGHSPQHGTLTHDYTVRNKGTETLSILKVRPGCGCTSAPIDADKLAPGDSTLIRVSFDTGRYKGKVAKSVTVYSNDPNQSMLRFYLNSIIDPKPDTLLTITWNPGILEFNKGQRDLLVEIENHGISPLKLQTEGDVNESLAISFAHSVIDSNQKGTISFHWDGEFAPEELAGSQTFSSGIAPDVKFTIPFVVSGTNPNKDKTPISERRVPAERSRRNPAQENESKSDGD